MKMFYSKFLLKFFRYSAFNIANGSLKRYFPARLVFLTSLIFIFILPPAGANPAAFLEQGVGARAMAMGGAFTAVSGDALSAYWNPAGLGSVDSINSTAMFQHLASAEWPGMRDISPSYQFFNIAIPLGITGFFDSGAAALSLISMNIDNIPLTEIDESGTLIRSSFSNRETAFMLSAGYPFFHSNILIGGSVRYITQDFSGISGASAYGWDLQFGKIIFITDNLNLGFTLERGPTLVWENGHRDSGGVKTKLGIGYERMISWRLDLLGTLDFIQKKEMPLQASIGAELKFDTMLDNIPAVFARAGINSLTIEDRYSYMSRLNENLKWSMGGGVVLSYLNYAVEADYAYINDPVGNNHLISLTARF